MLQSGQQLTSDWLLTDREHCHRKITERCGGVQLIAAYRPQAGLPSLGNGVPRHRRTGS